MVKPILDAASVLFKGTQVISQLQQNQNIQVRTQVQSLSQYFASHPGLEQQLRIRGQDPITATMGSLRVKVYVPMEKSASLLHSSIRGSKTIDI